jgi:hypothetical protein
MGRGQFQASRIFLIGAVWSAVGADKFGEDLGRHGRLEKGIHDEIYRGSVLF